MFQHPQHGTALAVADGVKKLADFRRIGHFLLNGVRVFQPVQAESAVGVHIDELGPHGPFREQPVHRFGADPGGETFVEPEVVPPFHGYQVAEPHMRHFVGHHFGHALPGAGRRVVRVHQQGGFAVGYAAPVFHGAGGKVGDGQMIQLGQRVADAEVVVEKRQQFDRGVQRKLALPFLAPGRPDADDGAIGRLFGNLRQVAHHKGEQIG